MILLEQTTRDYYNKYAGRIDVHVRRGKVLFRFYYEVGFQLLNEKSMVTQFSEVETWITANCRGQTEYQIGMAQLWVSFYDNTDAMRFKLEFM